MEPQSQHQTDSQSAPQSSRPRYPNRWPKGRSGFDGKTRVQRRLETFAAEFEKRYGRKPGPIEAVTLRNAAELATKVDNPRRRLGADDLVRCSRALAQLLVPGCGAWRRGGKSIVLALIAAFLSCFIDWTPFLAPGERGTIIVIATDRKQARVIFRYLRAMLTKVPLLAPLVSRETAEALDLDNGVTIEFQTASFKTTRG